MKYVYRFPEGDASMRDLLGGKGAGLAEMTVAGAPVPPGFTITTEACNAYTASGGFPDGMWEETLEALAEVERQSGREFGSASNPLLLSVRSGARFSMPGMMDTILNLGLNDEASEGLAKLTGDRRFAADAYRRLIQLFGRIVLGVEGRKFDAILEDTKGPERQDTDLDAGEMESVVAKYKELVQRETGAEFPQDAREQLRAAIAAVFRSWNGRRAIDYRRLNKISDTLGTAVNVQAMVFGNMGPTSATGVAFSRNPATGEDRLYGEFLVNAQGEDVVAGVRTPRPIDEMREVVPEAYEQFARIAKQLEDHFLDVQDIEFTIEKGKLYVLQTRTAKRTGAAALRIAVEMANKGLIDRPTAVLRVEPAALDQLLHPMLDPDARATATVFARGLPASPGAASGKAVFDPDEAVERNERGEQVILVRTETAPEDFHGMAVAAAVLTARGGMTSHAAVVARGMGKPCITGAGGLEIDEERRVCTSNGVTIADGEPITMDGSTGEVFAGTLQTTDPEPGEDFATLMAWADTFRTTGVRTNADTEHDALVARRFGAEGIGLCRTEHMFFEGDQVQAMREMIVADNEEERRAALAKIEPLQREDFVEIFRAMDGLPVTIRTLDPPLHEFLPSGDTEVESLASSLGVSPEKLRSRIANLREVNPMLGLRGCRLGILYPEVTEMQARAIFQAAAQCRSEGVTVQPEIMIPLVNTPEELRLQTAIVHRVAAEEGFEDYLAGTMIELPRAALVADRIAEEASFFSFGTNDLTQTTMGISRDDSTSFVPLYLEHRILPDDPFQVLDQEGVGQLVQIGVEHGRKAQPDLKIGVCGEHGGEPSSVAFFVRTGVDYVSCSPYRVPIARLAAAQAVLRGDGTGTQSDSR